MPGQIPAARVSLYSPPRAGDALLRRTTPLAVCRTPQAPPVPGDPAVHPPSQETCPRKREEEARDPACGQQPQDFLHRAGPLVSDATGKKELERPLEGIVGNAAETGSHRGVLVGKQLKSPGAVVAADPPDCSSAKLAFPIVDEEAGTGAVRAAGSVSHEPHLDRRAGVLRGASATIGERRGPRIGGAPLRDASGRHRPSGPRTCCGPRASCRQSLPAGTADCPARAVSPGPLVGLVLLGAGARHGHLCRAATSASRTSDLRTGQSHRHYGAQTSPIQGNQSRLLLFQVALSAAAMSSRKDHV